MSVLAATAPAAEADQARIPEARTVSTEAPATATDRVQAAVRALLAATDIDPHTVAQELDQARKREVAGYLSVLADGLDRLTSLIGAATDQADQFTGSTDAIAEIEEALTGAHLTLSDLAAELHPISS